MLVRLPIDDSVFERASIRLASFEGEGGCAEEGTIESNIVERSLASFVGSPGEGEGAIGDKSLLRGEPYVTVTLGFINGESSGSISTLAGDGVRSMNTLRRFSGVLSP